MVEREGFELSVHLSTHDELATPWFQPNYIENYNKTTEQNSINSRTVENDPRMVYIYKE